MSVGGPCLWLPSPAAASHLSAWTHHHPHHHPDSQRLPAVSSITTTLSRPSELSLPPGHELMPPKHPDDRSLYPISDAPPPLSRLRGEDLSSKDAPGGSSPRQFSPDRKRKQPDDTLQQDRDPAEGTMTPSDDGAGSPAGVDRQLTPSEVKVEKKKMKRFRLTHNQTRFLMSEFTRQAHPDAAHRERLSKEIPGLTPRQVQVWFQNRRAKLKRLTTNDRERMLKSRALPDDFDTTQVLRTPFEHKSDAPMLLTSGLQRSEDEYAMSPLSAPSAGGNYFASTPGAERPPEAYPTGPLANRPIATPLSDMQRSGRSPYPFPRSSSFSDAYPGLPHLPSRFSSPSTESLGHPGMPYRRPMDYGIPRPANGMIPGYDTSRPVEGSVSPTDQQEPVPYGMDNQGTQVPNYHPSMAMPPPKGFAGLEMNSPMQPHRQIPGLHPVPVSETNYRPYSYEPQSYSINNNNVPLTQANASSMSLPATFPPDTGHMPPVTADGRMNPPQMMDPRAKYGGQSFDYASYL